MEGKVMRLILRTIAVISALVLFGLATGSVATADGGDDLGAQSYPCVDGYSCYWDTAGYPGVYDAKWVAPSCGWHHLTPIGWGDRISTVANRSGHATVYLYNWEGYWRWVATIYPRTDFNLSGYYANNKTDAVSITC
jgi:hypothetical protein